MDIKNTQGDVILTIEAEELKKADFYRASLPGADFKGADLTRVRFYNADLKNADFTGATLRWASFQIADLRGAKLAGADMANVNLIDTNLCGVDLSEVKNLKWAIIKGTKYDKQTRFPKEINPAKENMILVTETTAAS